MSRLFRLLSIIILAICCVNCSEKPRSELASRVEAFDLGDVSGRSDNSFQSLLSEVNEIKLPFSFSCGIESYNPVEEYNSAVLNNIAPKKPGIGMVGKLPTKNGNEYLIYGVPGDIVYPYLYIYNSNGKQLDSLYLHNGYCIADEEIISSNHTLIDKDFTITMLDSIRHIHYNSIYELFDDSVTIIKKQYKLGSKNLFTICHDTTFTVVY